MSLSLKFKKLTENAFKPVKGSKFAAGFDLQSAYDMVIPGGKHALVKTDIAVQVPEGCYGRIAPRSGLALKKFIDVGAGVVDRDYRGNVGVIIFNFHTEPFEIKKGDKIAQFILEKYLEVDEAVEVEELEDTVRGADGFGSTDAKNELEPEAKKLKTDGDAPVIEIEN